jgi:hypothetical protein
MPKAFTHLCKEVNLSIYADTFTIYSKSASAWDFSNQILQIFFTMGCSKAKVQKTMTDQTGKLEVSRFVHREDPDHSLYHMDDFERECIHCHAQFERIIDKMKLANILQILEEHRIISSAEHHSVLEAYQNANSLPVMVQSLREQKDEYPGDLSIQPGDNIIIKELTGKKSATLNGRSAVVESFDANTGRFVVNVTLEVNDIVVIHSLSSESGKELNGKTVTIASVNKDRFTVDLYNLGSVTQKAIKTENLQYLVSLKPSNLELEHKPSLKRGFPA